MVGYSSGFEPTFVVKFFSAGTAACIADCFTFPLDTAKVRLQIQGEGGPRSGKMSVSSKTMEQVFKYKGPIGTIRVICQEEGIKALYNGIVPGLQRQMCFASIRIGCYDSFKDFYTSIFKDDLRKPSFGTRVLAGITTGALAILVAQPTDVVKVRMQAQSSREPKRYSGALNAYRTIATKEGIKGLWRGTCPNIARNAVVNASELVTYDLIKEKILSLHLMTDNLPCHFVSAFGAGFCTTVIASPVDVVKTRFMNSNDGQYSGVLNCASKMFREGGFPAFYKGFFPSFLRLGSWNVAMFVCYEQLKRAFTTNRLIVQ